MDTWQPSNLSWSCTRKNRFDCCRRRYFYDRFWGQDPKRKWWLFEMRNITTLAKLRGQVVHDVIAAGLNSIREGRPFDPEIARDAITDALRTRYIESAKKLWHIDNRPRDRKLSQITCLLEHYYDHADARERAQQARQIAWACTDNLLSSDLWRSLAEEDSANWREIDDPNFPSFDLDGIQVYVRVDFAHTNGAPTIIDWKTGARGDDDRKQLLLYALYAQAKWGWEPRETSLSAVYLQPEFQVESFTPTQDDLDTAEAEVKFSFNEMMELEPAYGPAKMEDFPGTARENDCRWCRFQGACRAEAPATG